MKNILTKRLLLVLLLIIGIVLTVYTINKQTSIYPYDVKHDYDYEFNKSSATITDLDIANSQIILPDSALQEGHSVFLKVNVASSIIGNYIQPSISVVAGGVSFTQYFEHGAEGVRYLNLSSFPFKDTEKIRIEGDYISIKDQAAQLISFKNIETKTKKILFIAPHPDDAEIASFGFYSDNKESYIITITAGEAGGYKYSNVYDDDVKHYLKKGELRTWNSLTVPQLGGISPEHTLNLGFFDSTLAQMFSEQTKVFGGVNTGTFDINTYRQQNFSQLSGGLSGVSNWVSLVENLSELLKEISPDIIVTPHPVLDAHPDHKFSTIALLQAIKKSGAQTEYVYLYTNHFLLNEYYPYGEIGGVISLPPNFSEQIHFDRIYSHALSLDKQKDKVFSLEGMNDLRPSTEWRFLKGTIKMSLRKIKNYFLKKETNYFDRSVRSNELFYVVNVKSMYKENSLDEFINTP